MMHLETTCVICHMSGVANLFIYQARESLAWSQQGF